MSEHFNGLTPAEAERLALLLEEMGEAIQVIGKILRHGYKSKHPAGGPTNRELLEKELGDVMAALDMLDKDISVSEMDRHRFMKHQRVGQYLHHQAKP